MEEPMTTRKVFGAAFLVLLSFALSFQAVADITLPPPQTEGGLGLFEALKKRSSAPGSAFPDGEVSLQDLSTVLWAATGLNRPQRGWTVPMAKGLPPYCKLYVAGGGGVWRYDWAAHSLREISQSGFKDKIGAQSFVKRAFYILVIVADAEALAPLNNEQRAAEYSRVAAGAMSQNIYLAAAALNLSTRYIQSINHQAIKDSFKLARDDEPICAMPLSRPAPANP